MKYFIIVLFLLVPSQIKYQVSFTDPRDGNVYKVIRMANLEWFAEDLRYVASKSWCEDNPSLFCNQSNFYDVHTLDSICPCEWRLPTREDWFEAIDEIKRQRGIPSDSVVWDTIQSTYTQKEDYEYYGLDKFHVLHDTASLNVKPHGWIQGKRHITKFEQGTYWLIDPEKEVMSHIHIHENRTLIHAHKHHILDKPRKVRRFQVRCVREIK